jgi:hypothetical protein
MEYIFRLYYPDKKVLTPNQGKDRFVSFLLFKRKKITQAMLDGQLWVLHQWAYHPYAPDHYELGCQGFLDRILSPPLIHLLAPGPQNLHLLGLYHPV